MIKHYLLYWTPKITTKFISIISIFMNTINLLSVQKLSAFQSNIYLLKFGILVLTQIQIHQLSVHHIPTFINGLISLVGNYQSRSSGIFRTNRLNCGILLIVILISDRDLDITALHISTMINYPISLFVITTRIIKSFCISGECISSSLAFYQW